MKVVVHDAKGQHLHPANTLVSPHGFKEEVLAFDIKQVFAVITTVYDVETAPSGLVKKEVAGGRQKSEERNGKGGGDNMKGDQSLSRVLLANYLGIYS